MRSRATEFFFIVAISAIATEILTPNILDAENLAPHGISTNPESVDLDGSGLPDFWEGLYNAQGIAPNADSDGDGFTNHEESISGTDPFDPYSLLKLQIIEKDATTATVAWIDRPSILESSVDLGVQDPWNSHEEIPYLDDGMRKLDFPIGDFDPKFFRIRNSSEDADSDGVPDWMEALMGFSTTPDSVYQPQSYDTDGDGNDDVSVSGDLAAYNEIYRVPQAGESLTRAQAARLLIQSTFGPGEMSLVDYVASIGAEAWIDEQIAQPASLHQPYIDAIKQDLQAAPQFEWTDPALSGYYINPGGGGDPYIGGPNYKTAWMRASLAGPDQLRQRVAWALSQILVASRAGAGLPNQPRATAHYYDNFVENAFGNFENILLNVTLHPFMGTYLSHIGNEKADPANGRYPDENYAREIMQLFSIGLWELNPDGTRKLDSQGEPIPTYDNTDITNLAEVFTGVNFPSNNFGGGWRDDGDSENQWMLRPMKIFASHHDWTVKHIPMGVDDNGNRLHYTIPANPSGDDNAALAEVETVVEQLVNHPNCAPFISRQLIQFLVTSNPSPAYVQRVATVFTDNGSGVTGDMEAIVKAILLDNEARNPLNHLGKPYFGHFREPTLRTVHLGRVLKLDRHEQLLWWDWGYYEEQSLQEPMRSPTVFNYYRPDFRLFGTLAENELDSPALGIVNSYSSISFANYLWRVCEEGFNFPHADSWFNNKTFPVDLSDYVALADDIPSLLDHLSILFCAGTLGANSRATISTVLQAESNLTERARLAVFLALISPEGTCLK